MRIAGGRPLTGMVRTPGDKSISHRALLLGALAEGGPRSAACPTATTWPARWPPSRPWAPSARADGATRSASTGGPAAAVRRRASTAGTRGPRCACWPGWPPGSAGAPCWWGDESLSSRPMDRVAEPLRAMGATVEGRGERCLAAAGRRAAAPCIGIEWAPPVASAQVKSAVLLAGLSAEGETVVREAGGHPGPHRRAAGRGRGRHHGRGRGGGPGGPPAALGAPPAGRRRAGRPLPGGLLGGGRLPGPGQRGRRGPASTWGPSGPASWGCCAGWGPGWTVVG